MAIFSSFNALTEDKILVEKFHFIHTLTNNYKRLIDDIVKHII